MTSAATDHPFTRPPRPSRADLRGRATGGGILGFFALGWTGWGISALPRAAGLTFLAVGVLASAAVGVLAVRCARRATGAPAADDPARRRAIGRRYGLIVAAEWIGLAAAAWAIDGTGHPQLIPVAITLGVGIHFFPLAALFHIRAYHLTGAALCLIALATGIAAPLAGVFVLWTLLPGFGSALTLYATCVHLLRPNTML
ncbi:hypothetical protein [Streptomyces sp. NPDC057375]|uniref:hypothetical protein n=1 Tax=Streptomyces sp. NPDC057375 TaxID=3346109 RepID=UPI0036261370